MQRKSINTLITDYLWGNTSDEDLKQLKEELERDPQLKVKYEQLLDGRMLAARYRQYATISAPPHPQRQSPMRRLRRLSAAAAIVAAVLLAGAYGWWRHYTRVVPPVISHTMQQAMQQSQKAGRMEAVVDTWSEHEQRTVQATVAERLIASRRVTTHEDKEFWQRLDDGTYVHLNYNTRLIYPEQFTDDTRDVVLDGEAYFMVATDNRRPFVVHTQHGDIHAYGTEFNVNTRHTPVDGESLQSDSLVTPQTTEVVLVKGNLGVKPLGSDREQRLNPGEQATFNAQLSAFEIERVDVESYVAWNEGKFSFQGWPLERVMSVLARWYGYQRTVFIPDALRQKQLDGAFSRYDDVHNIIESIATVLNLDITLNEQTITIQQ